MDVAITGIGLHPFGRFDGSTVTDMGVTAVKAASSITAHCWSLVSVMGNDVLRLLEKPCVQQGRTTKVTRRRPSAFDLKILPIRRSG